jgi:hypothetical protein
MVSTLEISVEGKYREVPVSRILIFSRVSSPFFDFLGVSSL